MDYSIAHGAPLEAIDPRLFQKPDAGDESLFVVFYMGVVVDQQASTSAGRLIARDEEFVRIMTPGDRNNIIDRPASDQDKRRFPKQYEQFKAGAKEEEQLVGTRLRDWPAASRGQVLEYEYLGIKTVEQLADLRDDVCSRMPGSRDFKEIAKAWLGRAKTTAEAAQQVAKDKAMQSRISELEGAIREQAKLIEKLRNAEQAKAA
ncbi:hypothetical protein GCM10028796_46760 [Ramlibacter monticola]|uniref:Uncharacterized protein n=1 Tax=Ramlibacter monticola TaxID=1926872 RepID=A0A936Z7A3_9BURK|nr:hypothetical protein [Ramlibacter monticola]MBL0394301.1 hypothetical protein [Ramlibacter monticola]